MVIKTMANEQWLIDAKQLFDWLWETVDDYEWGTRKYTADDICSMLEDAPKIDAVEVVHGRWERVIPTKSAAKWSIKVSCSVCHRQGYTHHKFCPNCGAKMDLE